MIVYKEYNRARAVEYARRWALSRNPLFTNFAGRGGDCTNFISQCIYAGSCQMNFTPVFGWYFLSDMARTASWTGVEFFYNFITANTSLGPFGREILPYQAMLGDVIQLGRDDVGYYHSLLIVGFEDDTYLVAAQSEDAFMRRLDSYTYDYARFIHIDGVRVDMPNITDCYDAIYNGEAIIVDGEVRATPNQ